MKNDDKWQSTDINMLLGGGKFSSYLLTFQRMQEYMHGGTQESSVRDRFMHGRFSMDRLDRHAVLFIYAHTRTRSARLNATRFYR